MNDMTIANPNDVIRAERAKIIAKLRAQASAKGEAHGAVVAEHTKQACTATAHEANKARVAGTEYSVGFVRGFVKAWKA